MRLPISQIRLDGGTQTRAEIDLTVANDYADAFRAGATFPAVVVFYDGTDYWLADGFHRVTGAKSALLSEIDADVRQGTRRDAILFSVGANASHGLRRTNADKRRAVETLLRDEEWRAWPQEKIAAKCGVSTGLVSKLVHELASLHGEEMKPPTRTVERNGVTYQQNTANIGKPRAPEVDAPPTSEPEESSDVLEPSNVVPLRSATSPKAADTSAFDADVRELRRLLTEARTLSRLLIERSAGLGGVVRAGRVADVRRLVAEALESLGEVKVAV